MPAVFRGNYVIDPDKEARETTPILNSYRFSQPTRAGSSKSASMAVWKLLSWLSYLPPACRLLHLPARPCYSSTIYPFFRFPVSNSAKLHAVLLLFPVRLFSLSFYPFLNFYSSSVFCFSSVPRAHSDSIVLLLSVFLLRELLRTSGPSWKTTNFPPYSIRGWTSRERRISRKITLSIAM